MRGKHPNKEIESAIREAETLGWECRLAPGHAWGHLYCPCRECNVRSVWSTPRDPEVHAKQIRRFTRKCPRNRK